MIEMQRRRLLLAFGEVISEYGLGEASVGRVCARAGVSRRTFYDVFPDREACLLAVVDSAIGRLSQYVLPAYRQEGRWCERVRRALSVLFEVFDEEPLLARVLIVETLKAGPAVLERRRQVLDALASAVDQGRLESRAGSKPPPLTAHGAVGGAISVIHARLLADQNTQKRTKANNRKQPLMELLNPLVSMIVYPYLGSAAARRELERPPPSYKAERSRQARDPFKDLPIRLTFRTVLVLTTINTNPGASNRTIADLAGVPDEGQMSKLLSRLQNVGLIENGQRNRGMGDANIWRLTERGQGILQAVGRADEQTHDVPAD